MCGLCRRVALYFFTVRASRLQREDLLSAVRAPALIYPNGTVEASHPAVYTVSCEINIKRFPLDDQRCALEIASWTYGKEKIRLHAHTEHSLEHYTDNEEWRLLKVSVVEDEYEHEGINVGSCWKYTICIRALYLLQVSELRYDVSVKRRPLFYMVTLTFPSYVMCAISVVGLFARFSTTGEREERFTLGVTAILTMAVLSLVVSEKVPHSSTHVPLLVAYFLFNMISVSVAAMTTGIVMKVHRMGRHGKEPEEWLLRLFCLRPMKVRQGIYTVNADSPFHSSSYLKGLNGELRKCESQPVSEKIPVLESYIHKLARTCENIQDEIDDIDVDDPTAFRRRREANGYVRISERLDLIFMTFFITLVTIPVIVLFYLS
ncbi:Neurotransmitter-gated ion-channel transmembrane region [Ancylostoma caninum]|uniref:Neurotransmitter-gated ion-channel transmembrane region n=1 Tax=Ancylostoma caninum TaxID=29170 RepID=A0A368G120_ANCCA|nr:Neurotransmitter-gated ion-channel transmembrane region [Ancylostoma caninum]